MAVPREVVRLDKGHVHSVKIVPAPARGERFDARHGAQWPFSWPVSLPGGNPLVEADPNVTNGCVTHQGPNMKSLRNLISSLLAGLALLSPVGGVMEAMGDPGMSESGQPEPGQP